MLGVKKAPRKGKYEVISASNLVVLVLPGSYFPLVLSGQHHQGENDDIEDLFRVEGVLEGSEFSYYAIADGITISSIRLKQFCGESGLKISMPSNSPLTSDKN